MKSTSKATASNQSGQARSSRAHDSSRPVAKDDPATLVDALEALESVCEARVRDKQAEYEEKLATGRYAAGLATFREGMEWLSQPMDYSPLRAVALDPGIADPIAKQYGVHLADLLQFASEELSDKRPGEKYTSSDSTFFVRRSIANFASYLTANQGWNKSNQTALARSSIAREDRQKLKASEDQRLELERSANAAQNSQRKGIATNMRRADEWKAKARALLTYLDEWFERSALTDTKKCRIVKTLSSISSETQQPHVASVLRKFEIFGDEHAEILSARCARFAIPERPPSSLDSYSILLRAIRRELKV